MNYQVVPRPLDTALAGLEQTVRENELILQHQPAKAEPLPISRCPSVTDLFAEKQAVYSIVRRWHGHAVAHHKKEAVAECDRVLAFLDALCK